MLHGINIRDIALIGANVITFCFAVIILSYKVRYK
jgi:MtN3 and saliva related transmembrane protein